MMNRQQPGFGPVGSQPYYTAVNTSEQAAALMQRVAYLLCTALLVTAGGAYLGKDLSPTLAMPLGIGTIVCVFALNFTRSIPGLNLSLLYVLSLLEGLFIGPVLNMIIQGYTLGGMIVGSAVVLTATIIAGLGTYVWISNKDFGFLGKTLFFALLGLIAIGVIGMFFRPLLANPHVNMLYLLAGVAIFVGFVLYDFSNIKLRYGPNDYVMATVQLYLDFINLFWLLLRVLMSLTGGGSVRRN